METRIDATMTSATVSQTGSPEHGSPTPDVVHALTASPAFAADGVLLSGRDSGLWRCDDGGVSFHQVFAAPSPGQLVTATSVVFAPEFPRDQTVLAGAAGNILRSRDGGRRWRPVALPPPPPLVTCLVLSPAYEDDGVVLAGTLEDGVLRSDDRGERWRRWNFGLLDLTVYCLAADPNFAPSETLFAGTETALFKSENGGRSWRETSFPEPAPPVLALAIDHRGVIWAGTEQHGIWLSSDSGTTWHRTDDGVITSPVNQLMLSAGFCLAVLPDAVMIADDRDPGWRTVLSGLGDDGGIAGVAAPWGITETTPLLVQQRNGLMRQLRIGIAS